MLGLLEIGTRSPVYMGLFALLALVAFLILLSFRSRFTRCKQHGIAIHRYPPSYFFVLLIIVGLTILALCRPYNGYTDISVPQQGTNVMFVIDISRSMLANDLKPSRMEVTRRKVIDALKLLKRRSLGSHFGITVFTADGYTLCPLTSDTTVVEQFAMMLSPDLVTSKGSNIHAGIEAALSRLKSDETTPTSFILLTDGEFSGHNDQPHQFSDSIPLYILGIGTPSGSNIPLGNGRYQRDKTGQIVTTRLEEDYLKSLASANKGAYMRSSIDDTDLLHIASRMDSLSLNSFSRDGTVRAFNEFGSLVIAGALLILILWRLLWPRGIAVILLFLLASKAPPASADPIQLVKPDQALDAYKENDFEQAIEIYRKRLKNNPDDRIAKRGLASALYKKGLHKESQELFHSLADQEKSGRDYFENSFNEGNALLANKDYVAAIEAYTRALNVKPNDPKALHNRKVARQLRDNPPKKENPPTSSDKQTSQNQPQKQPENQDDPQELHRQDQSTTQDNSPEDDASKSEKNRQSSDDHTPKKDDTAAETKSEEPSDNDNSRKKEATLTEEETSARRSSKEDGATPPPSKLETENPTSPSKSDELPNPHEEEVNAWLESLPDSPLMIRKKLSTQPPGEQLW